MFGGEAETRGFMVKCEKRPIEGEVCEIPVTPPHELWCYGNRGMLVGGYLVCAGLGCRIMSQDGRNAFPWHGLFNEWDAVVADGDGVCEN